MPENGPVPGEHMTSLHLRRAKEGDRTSLGWLIEHLHPLLLAQASYRLGTRLRARVEPEDLVQDVWAVAFPRLAELRARDGRQTPVLLAFLSSILLHQVHNLARKTTRRGVETSLETETGPAIPDLADPRASCAGPATQFADAERQEQVLLQIQALPPIYRDVLVLRGIEQQELEVVAALLGVSTNTIAQRWRRALALLRGRLPDSVFDELDG